MTIGELDRRITLETPVLETNDYGESFKDSWAEFRTVWAKVEWKGGKEGEDSGKITATTLVNFYIRNLDFLSQFDPGGTAAYTAPIMESRIAFAPAQGYNGAEAVVKYYYFQAIEQIEGRERFLKIITKQKD
jgi:hypothetical protein|tara:strand:- start:998 stop:1393 length:396 start_codon:yes stop_codon:yes gene_type:complete